MAKRSTTIGLKSKSRRSHKTKKRLAVKKLMLEAKAGSKKGGKKASKKRA